MENDLLTLLEKIKGADETAFNDLLEKYGKITESAVRRFSSAFDITDYGSGGVYSRDDLRQIATIALYRAADTYDPVSPEKGENVSFGLYAKICVNNALISALRKCRSEKRRVERANAVNKATRKSSDPLEVLVSSEEAAELTRKIKDSLSDYERKIYDYYIIGKSTCEIAAGLNKSEKSVSNALYRIKVKVRGLLQKQ